MLIELVTNNCSNKFYFDVSFDPKYQLTCVTQKEDRIYACNRRHHNKSVVS